MKRIWEMKGEIKFLDLILDRLNSRCLLVISRDVQRQLNIQGQEDLVFRDVNLRIIIIDLSNRHG